MTKARARRGLHLEPWQRTMYIVVAAQAVTLIGFGISTPFLPFFIQDLGVTRLEDVAFWVGLISSAAPLAQAAAAPVWGLLADRFGCKPMLVRSLLGGGTMFCLIGIAAQNVPQLAIMRIIQMALAGSVTAATMLVATTVPQEEVGFGLGLVQTAAFVGQSFGPMIGGVIGALFGYRAAFLGSGFLVLLMATLVILFVHEDFTPPSPKEREANGFRSTLRLVTEKPILVTMVAVLLLNNVGRSVTRPVLPLYVQTLVPTVEEASTATGLIVGAAALASAIAAVILGKMGDRLGRRRVLMACLGLGALLNFPAMLTQNTAQLLVVYSAIGFAAGGVVPVTNAIIAEQAPEGRKGSIYGVSSSLNAFGRALGPIMGTFVVTSLSVGSVFPVTGLLLGVVAVMVFLSMRTSRTQSNSTDSVKARS